MDFEYTHLRHLLTGDQSRQLDRLAIETIGIDGFTLMETAGKGAAEWIVQLLKDTQSLDRESFWKKRSSQKKSGGLPTENRKIPVLCLCGKGNNAGDALVTARYLVASGHFHVDLFLAMGDEKLTPDTARNLSLFWQYSPHSIQVENLEQALYPASSEDPQYEVVLDGLLGSGLSSPLKEPFGSVIQTLNEWKGIHHHTRILSMDLPSGLQATTGESMGHVVEADVTFSFGPEKTGLLMAEGPHHAGHIVTIPLAFPLHLYSGYLRQFDPSDRNGITGAAVPPVRRSTDTHHKYDQGVVYVIGGSPGLTGAVIMASKAAWKKGAGAVFLITPDALLSSFEHEIPEIIKFQTGTGNSTFDPSDVEAICIQLKERPGVVVLGPGLSRNSVTNGFLKQFIQQMPKLPLILDADALRGWNVSELSDWIQSNHSTSDEATGNTPIILTPHPGEAKELFEGVHPGKISEAIWGDTPETSTLRRLKIAAEISGKYKVTVCSKGDPVGVSDIVTLSDDSNVYAGRDIDDSLGGNKSSDNVVQVISHYPTEGFHRAGFGDVLSGQIAANLSFGADPIHAVLDALLYGFERWKESDAFLSRTDHTVAPEDIL